MCANREKSDAELVEKIRSGELEAFDVLFDRHRRGLMVYVKGITRRAETAEEIVQDCFLIFLKKIDSVNTRKNVSGWLYRTARNKAIDVIRKSRFETVPGDEFFSRESGHAETDSGAPDKKLEEREQGERAEALLDMLPVEEKEVLVMRYYNEYKFRKISELLDRPLGTVLWQARRGLERMREVLNKKKETG